LIVLSVLVTTVCAARNAKACSCAAPDNSAQAILADRDQADAVFQGKVHSIAGSGTEDRTASFEVSGIWKGDSVRNVDITTAGSDSTCGYVFLEGSEYLVFAYLSTSDGKLHARSCTRTVPLSSATEELAALGAPAEPPPIDPPVAATGCAAARGSTTADRAPAAALIFAFALALSRTCALRRTRRMSRFPL
jgi:hypothetical protein